MRDWQQGVLDLVRTEGADKRATARFLAYGVNGLGVALMVVVFASTAGITGAEVGIAGGSAVVGQKLLEAVFGDQAVRRLAERRPHGPATSGCRRCWTRSGSRFLERARQARRSRTTPRRSSARSRRAVDDLRFAQRMAADASAVPRDASHRGENREGDG